MAEMIKLCFADYQMNCVLIPMKFAAAFKDTLLIIKSLRMMIQLELYN